MKTKRKVSTLLQKRRAQSAAAMPEVKKLVKRFGRAAVGNCLAKLRDHDKQLSMIAALKREVAALERMM